MILFISSFTTSSARFSEFDAGNVVLFLIKVFGRKKKETTLGVIKYQNGKFVSKIYLYLLLI